MKLKINKACDLASISVLPPRRAPAGGGGGASASASAAAASQQRSQSMSRKSLSQGGGASFSQGVGSGGASFSQGRGGSGALFSQGSGSGGAAFSQVGGAAFSQGSGGGGAAFSQGGGGGGAAFSQGGGGGGQGGGGGGAVFSQGGGGGGQGGGGGGAAFSQGGGSASLLRAQSQISQASLDLLHPSPARDQRFALHDDSSKRKSSFPANSASCVREESQLQLVKIPSRCQVNEEVERKFQHVASSVHKMEMLLDSVQNDVVQLNRSMKEASLDSGSIQKKFVLVEDCLQQLLKGQVDLKALLLGIINSNPEQMSVLNSHTSKLDEISSMLSILNQVPEDLKQLKGEIFRIYTKEMEGVVQAIISLNSRPDAIQTLADQSCISNEKLLMSQSPVANGKPQKKQTPVPNGKPQMKQTPVANGKPQKKQTPVPNGKRQMRQTPVANGRLQMNHAQIAQEANGKPLMNQIAAAQAVPAEDVKPEVEEGKVVKAVAQKVVASGWVAPKQKELGVQKINPQVSTKKLKASVTESFGPAEGTSAQFSIIIGSDDDDENEEEGSDDSRSCVILKTGTGVGVEVASGEEVSEDALEILRLARKRRRGEASAIDLE